LINRRQSLAFRGRRDGPARIIRPVLLRPGVSTL